MRTTNDYLDQYRNHEVRILTLIYSAVSHLTFPVSEHPEGATLAYDHCLRPLLAAAKVRPLLLPPQSTIATKPGIPWSPTTTFDQHHYTKRGRDHQSQSAIRLRLCWRGGSVLATGSRTSPDNEVRVTRIAWPPDDDLCRKSSLLSQCDFAQPHNDAVGLCLCDTIHQPASQTCTAC